MESITRIVDELTQPERQLYEAVLGHELRPGQKILIRLIEEETTNCTHEQQTDPSHQTTTNNGTPSRLPDWCDVFRGLSDEEIDAVDEAILSRSRTNRQIDFGL